MALSVRSSVVTGSDKKAKPAEKQTPDPKSYQSQLKQLEARMKEQLKQIQHQVTGECHPVPTSLLVTAVSVAALASECPQTRARQLTEINFGSADVGVGYGSTSAGQKQKRADSAEISEQITEHVGNDSVKHLELLEHMASKFKTNNPDVEPDKHVAAAVEMGGGEGFCLAEVESQGPYELDAGFDADGVAFQAGDEVLDVHKYEPVEQGSCTFVKTGKHFLVLVEDVRKTGIRPKVVASGGESRIRMSTRGRAGGSHSEGVERYVLCAKDKAEILASIVPPALSQRC